VKKRKGKSKYYDRVLNIKFTVFVYIDAPNVIPRGRVSVNEGLRVGFGPIKSCSRVGDFVCT